VGLASVPYCQMTGAAIAAMVLTAATAAQVPGAIPGRCTEPPSTRTGEIGCYLLANQSIDRFPEGSLFWHLYSYETRAAADSAQAAEPSAVVEAFGKVWRFTIANASWRATSGERVAAVGPLQIPRADSYVARYMEGTFPPNRGMLTTVHRHSGPEAWYVLTGAQCLRTPDKTMVLRSGEGGTVPSGPPMVLTSIGSEIRRSFVLVLHDASQTWQTNTSEWTPTSECPAQ
jgi:hypothetical protein